MSSVQRPELSAYRHLSAGKVRDIYEIDEETVLIVASDRISAFDWVLDTTIPDKGRVLTAMSWFFFDRLDIDNHLDGPVDDPRIPAEVLGRAMVCRKLSMLPIECVARGYLTGSGLVEYRESGTVCGIALPEGLTEASPLPEVIFTPATKAEVGDHDENISFDEAACRVGLPVATALRDTTVALYTTAARIAREREILLADTKFEFGIVPGAGTDPADDDAASVRLVLADEVLTPDSSRYWPAEGWEPGRVQPSFDKQYVRNWLTSEESGWDRAGNTPPPALPDDVVRSTRERYIEAYERLSGRSFTEWPG